MKLTNNKAGEAAADMQEKRLLVSCLMVTTATPSRLAHLKRTIFDFCAQSYPHRVLQIFVNGLQDDQDIVLEYVETLGRSDIEITLVPGDITLGQFRTISLAGSRGDVIAQWDDDDRHHPLAIEDQLNFLTAGGYDAVFLQDLFQYFPSSQSLFWTNWRLTEISGHPGTLMMKRTSNIAYPLMGPEALRGEDTAVARQLLATGKVGFLSGAPHLFIYTSHGANTYGEGHHAMLAAKLAISQGLLRRREADIRRNLRAFDFRPGELQVVGSNGLAFTL